MAGYNNITKWRTKVNKYLILLTIITKRQLKSVQGRVFISLWLVAVPARADQSFSRYLVQSHRQT